jgi:hypothetical protein
MLIVGILIALFIAIPILAITHGTDTYQNNGWGR